MMDIVVPSIRDLDFLEVWKPFIKNFHIIIVQVGDPEKQLKIPSWVNYELYNRNDIERTLADRAWIISKRDASIRNFGFLVSDKELIYTLDDNCFPATDNKGNLVNSIEQHAINLMTPSTPLFFNTVYDPFRPGVDFVRGYPYSLREGVPTAVSHGLWMNAYDYDAPTQLLKVSERNTRYHDVTLTIPRGVLYPMCSMNVAFNKTLIGPAFMQGLMGDGQPWARYDDMFCGWASKVVGDHIGAGTKSGAPYIRHNKAFNPFTDLKKEYMGLFWQDGIIQFFQNITLSGCNKDAASAYMELADLVGAGLSHLNPYFSRLGKAMKLWVTIWKERFDSVVHRKWCLKNHVGCNRTPSGTFRLPKFLPVSSRSSMGPSSNASTCAIFTIVRNEATILPIFLRYYSKQVPVSDIWILDHDTTDGSTSPDKFPQGINYRKVYGDKAWSPHHFMNRQVEIHQQRLFRSGYKCVLFVEGDEIIVADTAKYPSGLKDYFNDFIHDEVRLVVRVTGVDIAHVSEGFIESKLDWKKPVLEQRRYGLRNFFFDKPLLSKIPLAYIPGHHGAASHLHGNTLDNLKPDSDLVMLHLHYVDKDFCIERELGKYNASKLRGKKEESDNGVNALTKKPFNPRSQCCVALSKVSAHRATSCDGKQLLDLSKWNNTGL